MSRSSSSAAFRPHNLVPLGLGILALLVGTAFGWEASVIDAVVEPPALVRAALVGGSVVLGGALLVAALGRLGGGDRGVDLEDARDPRAPDIRMMVRGVRLVFLAVAAFAAAGGWILGHPLPLVIALVIAGVDIIETSFLLLVVGRPAE